MSRGGGANWLISPLNVTDGRLIICGWSLFSTEATSVLCTISSIYSVQYLVSGIISICISICICPGCEGARVQGDGPWSMAL